MGKERVGRAWRPALRTVVNSPVHWLAFGFGTGLAPVAPGTFGTLVGIPLWLLLRPLPLAYYLAAIVALFAIGCWICGASARQLGVHDYGGIVFDEIVGYAIAATPLIPVLEMPELPLPVAAAVAFVLFRFFDIVKPWPIGALDRRVHGGLGIMLDDAVAGLFAALVIMLGLAVYHDAVT